RGARHGMRRRNRGSCSRFHRSLRRGDGIRSRRWRRLLWRLPFAVSMRFTMLLLIPTRLLLGALLTAAGSAALIVPVASPAPTASSPLAALALFAVLAARLGIAAASRPGAGSPWSFLALPVLVLLLVRFRAMEFGPPLAVAFLLWAPAPAIATAL